MHRLVKGATVLLVAVALEACASQVPLDNSPCPCPESLGYACCGSGSTARCVRRGAGETCPGTGPFVDASPNDGGDAEDASTPTWVDAQPADAGGPDTPTVSPITWVAIGADHACGLRADHTISCIGDNSKGQATPPEGQFRTMIAGADFTCASRIDKSDITRDGTLVCWGDNSKGQATPPEGQFSAESQPSTMVAGADFACASRIDRSDPTREGMFVCWGDNTYGQTSPPPGAFYIGTAGARHACGYQTDFSLVCWGDNSYGQATVPAGTGTFSEVTAGRNHTCAIKRDSPSSDSSTGTFVCWGDNSHGQLNTPKLTSMMGWPPNLIAGGDHTCFATSYEIRCWGENSRGQSTPPVGFGGHLGVAAGHACVIDPYGSREITCWGNDWGTAGPVPPKGQFSEVFVGDYLNCASPWPESNDGRPVTCWGPTYEPWH